MGSERGQATIEWTGLLLLVALVLVAVGRLAPRADGSELGATLAHAVTHPAQATQRPIRPRPRAVRPRPAPPPRPTRLPPQNRPGALARKVWFACLVYQRVRYSIRHPVSRLPGYTFRYGAALRIAKRCLNPLDLLREIPSLNPMG
jgi:Flp pilus assembly pilin Flp